MLCIAGALAFSITSCGEATVTTTGTTDLDSLANDALDELTTEVETSTEAPDTATTEGHEGIAHVCNAECTPEACVTKCGEEGHECGEACHAHAEGEHDHDHAEGEEHTH